MPRWRPWHVAGCCGCGSAHDGAGGAAWRRAAAWPGSPTGQDRGRQAGDQQPARRPYGRDSGVPSHGLTESRRTESEAGCAEVIARLRGGQGGLAEILADRGHVCRRPSATRGTRAAVAEHTRTYRGGCGCLRLHDEAWRRDRDPRRDHPGIGCWCSPSTSDPLRRRLVGAVRRRRRVRIPAQGPGRDVGDSSTRSAGWRPGHALRPGGCYPSCWAQPGTTGLGALTAGKREVLGLMAEGRSNGGSPGFSLSRTGCREARRNIFRPSSDWRRRTPTPPVAPSSLPGVMITSWRDWPEAGPP